MCNRIIYMVLACICFQTNTLTSQNEAYIDPIYNKVNSTTVYYSDVFNDNFHKMDIYQASDNSLAQRPLLIYIHGGAFYAGDKATPDCVDFCTEFAKKGYVAVSVNYRLANPLQFLADKKVQLDAVLKTMADVKAAIRYFYKDANNNNTYKIDTNAIFIGGYSAGAVAALHTAWVTDIAELDNELQTILRNGIKTLEGDAGNYGYNANIQGIFSLAGALYQTHYADSGDVPAYLAHAKNDQTVLFECAPGLNNPMVVTLCGTGKIYPRLDSISVSYDTMILETGGHEWPGAGNNNANFKIATKEIAEFFYPLIPSYLKASQKILSTTSNFIYPNPSNGTIRIAFPEKFPSIELQLFDMQGKLQFQRIYQTHTTEYLELPKGMYVAKWQGGNHISSQLIVLQ